MDLDNLKQVWKAQQTASFSKEQILAMRQKRSSSIAKWIFYISLAEFIFWIGISFIIPEDKDTHFYPNTELFLDVFTYLNYAVVIGFIYIFFRSYQKIKAHQTPKKLLQNIFRMRKMVQYYIICNLAMFLVGFLLVTIFMIVEQPESFNVPEAFQSSFTFLGIMIFAMLVFLGILFAGLYFFYRLLYGFLLRRLQKNYNEIKDLQ